ncbi:hypothetical protein C362_00965 [Cryptococcus neoformans Bt1]|nr:hypothetical protein C362_00965 [Cryptococcus neoformans var. grubii Bt1]
MVGMPRNGPKPLYTVDNCRTTTRKRLQMGSSSRMAGYSGVQNGPIFAVPCEVMLSSRISSAPQSKNAYRMTNSSKPKASQRITNCEAEWSITSTAL